jgi:hypothetical protein
MPVEACLSINSGTVTGLDLVAPSASLPEMRLLWERPDHVDAKTKGIVRELQTGDTTFDAAVYIESSATDDAVRTVLASPAVRTAAVKLLQHVDAITVRGSSVCAFVPKSEQPFDPPALRERLGWLRVVAGAPRPLEVEYTTEPLRATLVKTLAYFLAPIAIGLVVIAMNRYEPDGAAPLVVGALVGLLFAALLQPLVGVSLRGRSTSHRDVLVVRMITLFWLPVLAAGLLTTLNGALDRSPERVVTMKVVSFEGDTDDASFVHVKAVDDKGVEHSRSFKDTTPRQGSTMKIGWRDGAFGWQWESRAAEMVTPAH